MPERLGYDPSGAFDIEHGFPEKRLAELAPRLLEARRAVLEDVEQLRSGADVPPEKSPLDAGFIELPELLLREDGEHATSSELHRICAAADRLASLVDRFVVVGIGGSYLGARALFESLCAPYHNEFAREQRGGRPRVYFDGYNVDDAPLRDLERLLRSGDSPGSAEGRWGMVAVSKSGSTLEPAVVFRILLRLLQQTKDPGVELGDLVLPVTGEGESKLRARAQAIGCTEIFRVPEGVGGRYSVLSAVGLLPAAVLGIDLRELLRGAADMTTRFREQPPGENPVLDFVGVCHLAEQLAGATNRVMCAWGGQLEALGFWYDQLLSESLGKGGLGATPITAVNTRDLHSRGQQHQDGRTDRLITNLVVRHAGPTSEQIGVLQRDIEGLDDFAELRVSEVMDAARLGTMRAYRAAGRPTADIMLPRLDAHAVGELMQMLMLSTAIEGRLIGVNPYGQPGVEAYKTETVGILRELAAGR